MGDATVGKRKTRLCASCGGEKIRTHLRSTGGYRYWCGCDSWKESLAMIARARMKGR